MKGVACFPMPGAHIYLVIYGLAMSACGQSGHTPLVYTAACHTPWRDPDWTMPDALNRGRAVCSSSQVASDRESRVFYRGVDSVAIG